ncbi:MAG: hypothetical protein HLUCCO07_15485 [Rhodobacteraceae bacterium HLUCCO07]|uniref:hypothetical protein n=1 Tax=Aquicoccus sp. TaxID=2055851 RepID=UPI0006DA511F|nr:MAG: hypothetical protein HLUCCO07_15485 [Rhodobacteraceae bacterium HLUCCO07]
MTFFKPLLASAFGLCAMTQVAMAQQVTATTVVGQSGSSAYPVVVVGSNGRTYHCRAPVETVEGQLVRRCVSANAGGTGLGTQTAGVAVGVASALAFIAVVSSDGT